MNLFQYGAACIITPPIPWREGDALVVFRDEGILYANRWFRYDEPLGKFGDQYAFKVKYLKSNGMVAKFNCTPAY